jgi:transposase-like protein
VKVLPFDRKLRRVKYLNNIIEALHMMRKGQVKKIGGKDAVGR